MPLPTIGRDVSPARRKALRSLAGKAALFLDTYTGTSGDRM
jgi:hypothetical protein